MFDKLIDKLAIHAHASRTVSDDPLMKFKFRLTVPGLPTTIGFQKVSGLTQEVAITEYDEGGYPATHKLPGRQKVGDITAERGEYSDTEFQNLVKDALTNPNLRNTVIFEKLDRFGNSIRTYKLAEAWVSKWEGSDADASSDDVAIEKITITFEYYL